VALSGDLHEAGISAREAEVLVAVGEHLTNAEIAERLFISVRTVESHVSSLLRKLGAEDRRALARLAEPGPPGPPPGTPAAGDGSVAGPDATAAPVLPSPLTPFVGRASERADLARAVESERLVTALGPGGVGKTRLALAVAGEVAGRFPGGVWYVDLVPVTAPGMVTATVAATLGVGEQPGRPLEDSLASAIGSRRTLLVLDNCEHLVDGVAVLVERLLTRCPALTVLATSRIRLVLPFERPFPVPGLSLPDDVDGPGDSGGPGEAGDAVALFLARAEAVGTPVEGATDRRRVAEVCRALDGMALAIELAASRLPVLGLDGLEAGLADRLRILTGGSRADERHRSLRATLDWSYALAGPADRAVFRRVAVFAAPFTVAAAAAVAAGDDGDAPSAGEVPEALARLVDQSLLVVVRAPDETRYRALEIVRQYAEAASDAAEWAATRDRHLAWCLATARALDPGDHVDDAWRAAFDRVADDLRAGLRWASAQGGPPARRAAAHELAVALADLAHRRGRAGEAQHRYEESAALTDDGSVVAEALHRAAVVASNRQRGNEAVALHQASADAALGAGDRVAAARGLALAATLLNRGPGIMSSPPEPGIAHRLLARAQALAVGYPELDAALLVADAFAGDEDEWVSAELAARAVELARRRGDPLTESAALDVLTSTQLAVGEGRAAAAAARLRTELLAPLPMTPEASFERSDAYQVAAETALGTGDLATARHFAGRLAAFPSYRDVPHLGFSRLLIVDALAGHWDEVMANGARYLAGWESAGRPIVSNIAGGALAVALVHGIRGEEGERARWLDIATTLRSVLDLAGDAAPVSLAPMLSAHVHLHRGDVGEALAELAVPPEVFHNWYTGMWRQWYAALWAEAATLAERDDAADRRARARLLAAGNPVATALVDRAAALVAGDAAALRSAAATLKGAGCHYQWARTLAFAGGAQAEEGRAALAALGATPMPPGPGPLDAST
jgi:predicted ATPase/DNA-binding CsgD family transcriptional regulator